jgi:hypothetical protein
MIDPSTVPDIEVDEDSDIMDVVWRSPCGNESFSIVLTKGKLVGIACSVEPPRSRVAWSIPLPEGMLSIDHTKMQAIQQS